MFLGQNFSDCDLEEIYKNRACKGYTSDLLFATIGLIRDLEINEELLSTLIYQKAGQFPVLSALDSVQRPRPVTRRDFRNVDYLSITSILRGIHWGPSLYII